MRRCLLAGFLLSLLATPALAQLAPPGPRLRVHTTLQEDALYGDLLRATRDTLTLLLAGPAVRVHLPLSDVTAAQRSLGRERSRWALLGGAGGLVGGGLLGGTLLGRDDPSGYAAFGGMIGGAFLGTVLGAVGGAVLAPERWVPYRIEGSGSAAAAGHPRLEVSSGTRVRVTLRAEGARLDGAVLAFDRETLLLEPRGGDRVPRTIARSDVAHLEVRGGRARARGAAMGALAVGGVAVVFGGIDVERGELSGGEYAAAIVGNSLAGAGIGWLLAPTGWRRVPLPR